MNYTKGLLKWMDRPKKGRPRNGTKNISSFQSHPDKKLSIVSLYMLQKMRCESSNFWQEILNVPDSRSWYECRCPEHMLLEEIFLNGIGKPHNVCYPGDHWAIQREGWTPKNQRKINLRFHGWAVLFVQYNKNKCFLILKKVKTKNVTMSKFKNNISHYYLL